MARYSKYIVGADSLLQKLRMHGKEKAKGMEVGLKKAGLYLQRESQLRVPVETGTLKNSAGTRHEGKGFETVVHVFYMAAYALFVHEAVGMKLKGQKRPPPRKGKYWDPQGRASAKFLESPAREKQKEMADIVRKELEKR